MSAIHAFKSLGRIEQRLRQIERHERVVGHEEPLPQLRMLDDVVAERRTKLRDCRDCTNYESDESGMNFGWCGAHKQHVKLYYPAGEWFSQCIFKGLRRYKSSEHDRVAIAAEQAALEAIETLAAVRRGR